MSRDTFKGVIGSPGGMADGLGVHGGFTHGTAPDAATEAMKDTLGACVEAWLANEMGIVASAINRFRGRYEAIREVLPLSSKLTQDVPRFIDHLCLQCTYLFVLFSQDLVRDKRGLLNLQKIIESGSQLFAEFSFEFGGFFAVTGADESGKGVSQDAVPGNGCADGSS